MSLIGPGLAAVQRLVEAQYMVVPLGACKPLARGDDVIRVIWVDPQVGFGVIVDEHRTGGRVAIGAARLVGIEARRPGIFAGRGTGRGTWLHTGVAVGGPGGEERDLGSVAAHLLGGRHDVCDLGLAETAGIGAVALHTLWDARPSLDGQNGGRGGHDQWHGDSNKTFLSHLDPPVGLPRTPRTISPCMRMKTLTH